MGKDSQQNIVKPSIHEPSSKQAFALFATRTNTTPAHTAGRESPTRKRCRSPCHSDKAPRLYASAYYLRYLGTAHDFLFPTASLMFCNFARRFSSRIAFPIAARISGSVGLPIFRLSLRASKVFAIFVPHQPREGLARQCCFERKATPVFQQ